MYATNIDFEDFIGFSMESASRMFRNTEQYKLLKEKSDKLFENLETFFNKSDFQHIETILDELMDIESQETEFLYRQAYKDCIEMLKKLEVKVETKIKVETKVETKIKENKI